MSRAWQTLWLTLLLVSSTSTLRAQSAGAEVILTEDSVSAAVFEILHAALSREGISMQRSAAAADSCSGELDPAAAVSVRVWLQWTKRLVSLCFQDRCGSSERVLGPFSELDARAREEIITVIEMGVTALPHRCRVDRADAAALPPSPAPQLRSTDTAVMPENPQPARVQRSAPADSDTELPASVSGLPAIVHSQASAAASDGERDAHTLLLAARYGLTRWSNRIVGQYLGGAVAYSVHPRPLFVGIEVDYVPTFRALQEGLAIDASSLRLAAQLWARWPLTQRAVLDVQLGPALDWISLTPIVPGDRVVQDRRAVDHVDPYVFARAGPSLRVYKALFVGIELQLDASFLARSYGFVVGQAQREVFAPDRVRMSVALHARAEL